MKKYILMFTVLLGSALMMQGFQCSSREMASAKVAINNNRDYDKGLQMLNAEIAKNPTNGEAYLLKAKVYIAKMDYASAAEALVLAEKNIIDPKLAADKAQTIRKLVEDELYNGAVRDMQKAAKIKKNNYLDSALKKIDIALIIRPQNYDLQMLAGQVYETKGDDAKALESYQKYIDIITPELNLAKKYNLILKMPRTKLVSILGNPDKSVGTKFQTGDTIITDKYIIDGKEAYFVIQKENNDLVVTGWRYDLPSKWIEYEKLTWRQLSTEAFASISAIYYKKNEFAKSLEAVKQIVALDPTNSDAYSNMIQLFQQLNKADEAVKLLNTMIEKDPGNKLYLSQYGDFFLMEGKYDDAIAQYEKALKIDPKYDYVLRNIAAAYKNKAAKIQQAESDLQTKDQKYKIDETKYMPFLEKSLNYFEQTVTTERFKEDFDVVSELVNLYMITGKKDKVDQALGKLEKFESSLPDDKKESYYLKMIKIYGALGNEAKVTEFNKKIEDLK